VWLSSYPKSGNTWLRFFLSNFESVGDVPTGINGLADISAASRHLFDSVLGVESSDMTQDEIERYRPWVYRQIAIRARGPLFLKVHDAYTRTDRGEPLIPAEATQSAIYLVRNPLDVAISFAHHSALTLNGAIDRMADETFAFSSKPEHMYRQLKQRLLSWSGHVQSWLDQNAIAVHVMRYEDMRGEPLETFAGALRFLGMDTDARRIQRALNFSSFNVLRDQEKAVRFRETPSGARAFFRSGRVGEWREVLTPHQVARVLTDHGAVMRRLGYLSENGNVQ
jgi:hypothetical protein